MKEKKEDVKDPVQEVAEDTAKENKEAVDLDVQEQQLIAKERERRQRLADVNEKIMKILKDNNATLDINPQSPIASPQIIVRLLK